MTAGRGTTLKRFLSNSQEAEVTVIESLSNKGHLSNNHKKES
jgi:hypothetical protein